jgi:hypothetical protein
MNEGINYLALLALFSFYPTYEKHYVVDSMLTA